MPYFYKSFRQYMQGKSAYKFFMGKCYPYINMYCTDIGLHKKILKDVVELYIINRPHMSIISKLYPNQVHLSLNQ